jgi:predicted SAM-dependent methyltransferase
MSMTHLHLGCGPIHLPRPWVNVDIEESHRPDVCLDYLTMSERPDIFRPGSVDFILSVHSIEHLSPYPDGVVRFFREAMAVMRPGGVIRVVVPDLMKAARKYVAGESLKDIYDGPFHYGRDCPAERFVYFCRAWQHTIVFDEPLLSGLMADAGFANVRRMPFGISDVPALCGVDRFESESMSIEGTRP